MLNPTDYINEAILTIREHVNGVDKSGRLEGESIRDSNDRRKRRLSKHKKYIKK